MPRRYGKQLLLNWYEQLVFCYERVLTEAERAELERFERLTQSTGVLGTADWPGWEKHIGKPPVRAGEWRLDRRREA